MVGDSGGEDFITLNVYSDQMRRARYLLALAQGTDDEENVHTLAGAAIIVAVGFLAQRVEAKLVQLLARTAWEDGLPHRKWDARSQQTAGLPARILQLAELLGNSCQSLDERQPTTRRLMRAIQLRNELVHDTGMLVVGTAAEVGVTRGGTESVLALPAYEDPWKRVSLELATFVVDACQSCVEEFEPVF